MSRARATRRLSLGLLLGCAAALTRSVDAARTPPELEPQPLRLRISDGALKLRMEDQRERRDLADDNTGTLRRDYTLFEPTASFTAQGSIIHPNLLSFSLQPEIGRSWYDKVDDSYDPPEGKETDEIRNFTATADLLKEKPFASHFSAARQEYDRDDDFFVRERVKSDLFEGTGGYSEGVVPFNVTLTHRKESQSSLGRAGDETQDIRAFNALNTSGQRTTSFSLVDEDFSYGEAGFDPVAGHRRSLGLTDSETLGAAQHVRLNSFLTHEQLDMDTGDTTILTLREYMLVNHTRKLFSQYNYSFTDRTDDGASSRGHEGQASLTHQLYESLESTVDAQGQQWSYTGEDNSSYDYSRYGARLSEQYTKKLPLEGRLSIHAAHGMWWQNQTLGGSSSAGGLRTVQDERHSLSDGDITLLDLPDVERGSVVVTDPTGTSLYRENLDYRLSTRGRDTQIERVIGGRIPNNGTVLVDYRASGQSSGAYTTTDDRYGFRLEFFERLIGLYARRNLVDSSGLEGSQIQDIDDVILGIDSTRRWYRVGLEYEDYQASYSDHTIWRTFENLFYQASSYTTLSLELRQQRTSFPDGSDDERSDSYIAHLQNRTIPNLSLSLEGGALYEKGISDEDYDRTLYTVRAFADHWIGQLTTRLGYEYENGEYRSDKTEQHLISLRVTRRF